VRTYAAIHIDNENQGTVTVNRPAPSSSGRLHVRHTKSLTTCRLAECGHLQVAARVPEPTATPAATHQPARHTVELGNGHDAPMSVPTSGAPKGIANLSNQP